MDFCYKFNFFACLLIILHFLSCTNIEAGEIVRLFVRDGQYYEKCARVLHQIFRAEVEVCHRPRPPKVLSKLRGSEAIIQTV